jgi:hypothetical protein
MKKVRVYIGCALTHASDEYKNQIHQFKKKLREVEWIEVLDFWSKEGVVPDPYDIYCTDIHDCVGTADAIVAELSNPSTGLGWELGVAVEKLKIRTIMLASSKSRVSHLPIGAPHHEQNGHVTMHYYEDSLEEILDLVLKELEEVYALIKNKP